jgi:hypothetical protein
MQSIAARSNSQTVCKFMRKFLAILVLLWLAASPSSHAQKSTIVQCRIGSFAEVMPDFACDALMKGAAKLRREPHSIMDCADEMLKYIDATRAKTIVPCNEIWARMINPSDKSICQALGHC